MKLVAIALLVLYAQGCYAGGLTVLETNVVKLLMDDRTQTHVIATDPLHYETNRILGTRPNPERIDGYFAGAACLYAIGTQVLDGQPSKILSHAVMFLQGYAIANNIARNVRSDVKVLSFTFPF